MTRAELLAELLMEQFGPLLPIVRESPRLAAARRRALVDAGKPVGDIPVDTVDREG